ncbi:oxygen-dependent choline dehydrogenase [Striga asiatica]|uniref:Oxygen-dependent choline dehydrogenase n=1 Tax=Striga asiatica TaxID=4170 RepID=A0A5A7Q161_STRAF|nr:oxygen-dependent choline dehydrogenase [Striga asiatica]
MEIPAWWYFWFWPLIGITFLHLGLDSLDRTDLSDSVHPAFMSLLKHSLATSTCCSSTFALILRPRLKIPVDRRYFWTFTALFCLAAKYSYTPPDEAQIGNAFLCGPALSATLLLSARLHFFPPLIKTLASRYSILVSIIFLSGELFPWYLHIFTILNFLLIIAADYYLTANGNINVGIHMTVESSLFLVSWEKTKFYPLAVMFVSYFVSGLYAGALGIEPFMATSAEEGPMDVCFLELVPLAEKGSRALSAFMGRRVGKLVRFGVGMVGTVLFQNFFRLTTFGHVVAFLYLAVAWLANMACLGVAGDFGVLNFLIGNVIVGCTVNQFGLHGTTWVAYVASLVLYGVRLGLESVRFESREGLQVVQFSLW